MITMPPRASGSHGWLARMLHAQRAYAARRIARTRLRGVQGGARAVGDEHGVDLRGLDWPPVEVALAVGAAELDEPVVLAGHLDALRDGDQAERGREVGDEARERPFPAVLLLDAVDERLRDLEHVDREAAQVAQ